LFLIREEGASNVTGKSDPWVYLLFGIVIACSLPGIFDLIRRVRGVKLARLAVRWNAVDGKVTGFTTTIGVPTQPVLTYTYNVNGLVLIGLAKGLSIHDDKINETAEILGSGSLIRVRYDPTHPWKSLLLNKDNPAIPFVVDPAAKRIVLGS
jgi:hypothetical protein